VTDELTDRDPETARLKAAFLSDEGRALMRRFMECDLSDDEGHAEAERLFDRLWALAHPPTA
jgi:hypothetical protein